MLIHLAQKVAIFMCEHQVLIKELLICPLKLKQAARALCGTFMVTVVKVNKDVFKLTQWDFVSNISQQDTSQQDTIQLVSISQGNLETVKLLL